MDREKYEKSIREIAGHYGLETQERKLFEEMAELTVALTHTNDTDEIASEMADVQIMIDQIAYLCFAEGAVETWKERKIERTLERVERERVVARWS